MRNYPHYPPRIVLLWATILFIALGLYVNGQVSISSKPELFEEVTPFQVDFSFDSIDPSARFIKLIISPGSYSGCAFTLGSNIDSIPVSDPDLFEDQLPPGLYVTNSLTFVCPQVSFPQGEDILTIKLKIFDSDASPVVDINTTQSLNLSYPPKLTRQFHWTPMGFAVEYIISTPWNHQTKISNHRLLGVSPANVVTDPHSLQNRLYNMLDPQIYPVNLQNENEPCLTFRDGEWVIDIDTFDTSGYRYICQSYVLYPPDVFFNIVYDYQHESFHGNYALAIINKGTYHGDYDINTSFEIMMNSEFEIPTDKPLIWRSPHHQREITAFEFAIAKPPAYDGENKLPMYVKEWKVDPDLTEQQIVYFLNNIESVRCTPHNSDYQDAENVWYGENQYIDISSDIFSFLGAKCLIQLDASITYSQLSTYFVEFYGIPNIIEYDELYRVIEQPFMKQFPSAFHLLYLPNLPSFMSSTPGLPSLNVNVENTTQGGGGGGDEYSTIRFIADIQPVLPYLTGGYKPGACLKVIFLTHSNEIIGLVSRTETPMATVHITSRGQTTTSHQELHPNDVTRFLNHHVEGNGQHLDLFHILRLPSFSIALDQDIGFNGLISSLGHLTVSIEIKLAKNDQLLEPLTLGMIFLPYGVSSPSLLIPHYAHVSPYAYDTPLPAPVRYAYKCVSWELLAAPFLPFNPGSLLPGDFVDCQDPMSAPQQWKIFSYPQVVIPDGGVNIPEKAVDHCYLYQSAVCVSGTGDVNSPYTIKPRSQCPSTHGNTFYIPCDMAPQGFTPPIPYPPPISCPSGNKETCWGYSIALQQVSYGYGVYGHDMPYVRMVWDYIGDPDLTVTITMTLNIPEYGATPPIILTQDHYATAFVKTISPYGSMFYDSYTSPPIYLLTPPDIDPEDPSLNIINSSLSIHLNQHPAVSVQFHSLLLSSQTSSLSLCRDDKNQWVNPRTRLCGCKPSYQRVYSDSPPGPTVHDIFINPSTYVCVPSCQDGYEWKDGNCILKPSSHQQCHPTDQLPYTLVNPVYQTAACQYGFLTESSDCTECQCFTNWVIPDNGTQCNYCKLRTVCNTRNTDDLTYKTRYCWRNQCLCKAGFYGDACQYRVMYGELVYTTEPNEDDRTRLANTSEINPYIMKRKQIEEFSPRVSANVKSSLSGPPMIVFIQQSTQYLDADQQQVHTSVVVAVTRDPSQSTTMLSSMVSPSSLSMSLQTTTPHTLADTINSDNFMDIYSAWEQFQTNIDYLPAGNDDQFGAIQNANPPYDPYCLSNPLLSGCPQGHVDLIPVENQIDPGDFDDLDFPDEYTNPPVSDSDNTTAYIIIGVVLGSVALIFIAVVVSIVYCRNNNKACFAKRSKQKQQTDQSTSNTTSSTGGVELASQASSQQSSHIPTPISDESIINDPTLPPDWIVLEDKSTGKIYYSNKKTLESSWDHPSKPKDAEENEYGW